MAYCSRQEFENQVHSKHPAKWINADTDPISGILHVFALDTQAECQGSFSLKYALASHVLVDVSPNNSPALSVGYVCKDVDNLFSNFATFLTPTNAGTYKF